VDSVASLPPTLDARIERLFEVTRPPRAPERPWRNSEVVAACRANGRDMSESHLSELRRGVKTNPTMKTLEALAWFFGVRVGYFIDDAVAEQVEHELEERAARLAAVLAEAQEAESLERDAARELQRALRESGVTKMAHRGVGGSSRERATMMRALAKALMDDDPDDGKPDADTART
jgi:transcriptional regulator with XRE-family HTH domain